MLPALARKIKAAHQIWLAATVPDFAAGRSFLAEVRADPDVVLQSEWKGIDPTTDPVLATYFLFHDADLATLRTALPTVQSCDLSTVYAETPPVDPALIRSTYLLPGGDRAIRPSWMRRIARQRLYVEPVELAGGHNCYAANPDVVADAIAAALASSD